MAMFENHASEVDAIELLLRRGIHLRVDISDGPERGTCGCDLFLTGKAVDMSLCIRRNEDRDACWPGEMLADRLGAFIQARGKQYYILYACLEII